MPRGGKSPQRVLPSSLGDDTRGGLERMNRRGLWAAGVVLILLVVGAGVLTVGTGYAKEEDAKDGDAGAKCSEATLHGQYLVTQNGVVIRESQAGDPQGPFAIAGYEVFDGNGKVKGVFTFNFNGEVSRNIRVSGTYDVKSDCTGTTTYISEGVRYEADLFIAPDGSMYTFVQTNPPERVVAGFNPRGTAKRVGE
jgi:hypothetical protein